MNIVHGFASGKKSPEYITWTGMIQRCTNPKAPNWKYYGALGVRVCERWMEFTNFLADMGRRPTGMTLDRYPDKNGDYELGNCRWATHKQQQNNLRPPKKRNPLITFNGESYSLRDWGVKLGKTPSFIRNRVRRGMTIEEALSLPSSR